MHKEYVSCFSGNSHSILKAIVLAHSSFITLSLQLSACYMKARFAAWDALKKEFSVQEKIWQSVAFVKKVQKCKNRKTTKNMSSKQLILRLRPGRQPLYFGLLFFALVFKFLCLNLCWFASVRMQSRCHAFCNSQ